MRILFLLTAITLLACSKKSGGPTGPGGVTPYAWSLNLTVDSVAHDSLLQGTTITGEAKGAISGRVRNYDPAILIDSLYIKIGGIPNFVFRTALNGSGDFSFPDTGLLGGKNALYGPIALKIFPRARDAKYKPSPDTLRVTLDRKLAYPWTLDLTMPGGQVLQGLAGDTSVTDTASGNITGKINGFNATALVDTVYFNNLTYPENVVKSPLDPAGNFQFDIFDLAGFLDGEHRVAILVKPSSAMFRPVPDSLHLYLTR